MPERNEFDREEWLDSRARQPGYPDESLAFPGANDKCPNPGCAQSYHGLSHGGCPGGIAWENGQREPIGPENHVPKPDWWYGV